MYIFVMCIMLLMYRVCICYLFIACFCDICGCVMGELCKNKFPEICFRTNNSFRILNNLPVICSTMHMFAKANVFSGKGII